MSLLSLGFIAQRVGVVPNLALRFEPLLCGSNSVMVQVIGTIAVFTISYFVQVIRWSGDGPSPPKGATRKERDYLFVVLNIYRVLLMSNIVQHLGDRIKHIHKHLASKNLNA